jgi:hypothetical protein
MQTSTSCPENTIVKMLSEFWLPHLMACEDLFTHLDHIDKSIYVEDLPDGQPRPSAHPRKTQPDELSLWLVARR